MRNSSDGFFYSKNLLENHTFAKIHFLKDLLLITPPFTQLNTPYPATAYLKGFLNTKNISSYQIDLGIEVILEIFSKKGVTQIFNVKPENLSENTQRIFFLF